MSGRVSASTTRRQCRGWTRTRSTRLWPGSERPIMTLDEILASLFPDGHAVTVHDGLVTGSGPFEGGRIQVVGVDGDTPLGVEGALTLSRAVLDTVRAGEQAPILVVVDSDSQRMSRRDELLGLNECLAHLAKALLLADRSG